MHKCMDRVRDWRLQTAQWTIKEEAILDNMWLTDEA